MCTNAIYTVYTRTHSYVCLYSLATIQALWHVNNAFKTNEKVLCLYMRIIIPILYSRYAYWLLVLIVTGLGIWLYSLQGFIGFFKFFLFKYEDQSNLSNVLTIDSVLYLKNNYRLQELSDMKIWRSYPKREKWKNTTDHIFCIYSIIISDLNLYLMFFRRNIYNFSVSSKNYFMVYNIFILM